MPFTELGWAYLCNKNALYPNWLGILVQQKCPLPELVGHTCATKMPSYEFGIAHLHAQHSIVELHKHHFACTT